MTEVLAVKPGGNWATAFFRSQLSDANGTVSNTKVLQMFIVIHALMWVSALLFLYGWFTFRAHGVVTMTDIVTFIGSATTLAVALSGTLGIIKTTGDAINNRAPNASAQVQPPEDAQPKQE